MIGETYGELICLKEVEKPLDKVECGKYFLFTCSCGGERIAHGRSVKRGNITKCLECAKKGRLGVNCSVWSGHGEISGTWWKEHVRYPARRDKREINIDVEYGWNLFLEQNRKCAFTGVELSFPERAFTNGNTKVIYTASASLDRIDSSKGYIKGNVQWVHKIINHMKTNKTDLEFIEWCRLVANYRK